MESIYTYAIFLGLILVIGVPYWIIKGRHRKEALHHREKSIRSGLGEPVILHPSIDVTSCIGCGSCVRVCPEDVLGVVDGRAAVVNGTRCISHALCAEACPVGGITMTFGKPKQGMEIPWYDENYQSNIPGLYIVGELGGIGLIRNAVQQGMRAIENITVSRKKHSHALDVAIVGAGPAGIGSALAAQAAGLRYAVLEQYDLGGSILHYPRQKLVLTSPVDLPLYGKLKVSEISKEELLETFMSIMDRFKLQIHENQKVEKVLHTENHFVVHTVSKELSAANVVLALGRRGSPRKLGCPGEELPKVSYRLIEAESYHGKHLLVVGGGDSAVEAAVGLSRQKGNTVTLSYRRGEFVRLKEKNEHNINAQMKSGKIAVKFNTEVAEIRTGEVILRGPAGDETLRNDFVFIFAGGVMPAQFLQHTGVRLRTEEIES